MSSHAASPRVVLLAAVFALHAGALVLLVEETRSRPVYGEAETSPLLVWLIEPLERPRFQPPPRPSSRAARTAAPAQITESPPPSPSATPAAPGTAIDWALEAAQSADAQAQAARQHERQARALAPTPSPMFAAPPKRHEFGWDYARIHRVEPIGGLGTVIHLNDRCAVALFIIIPFGGGCALGKPAARGDLFDHMHDPEP